ncbi:hypothetical protein BC828DRAFT_270679 [Blastocladiella britannica]|nr:hypothetical protein BC828DRAFT_270679 [Blastocladiella britannica]
MNPSTSQSVPGAVSPSMSPRTMAVHALTALHGSGSLRLSPTTRTSSATIPTPEPPPNLLAMTTGAYAFNPFNSANGGIAPAPSSSLSSSSTSLAPSGPFYGASGASIAALAAQQQQQQHLQHLQQLHHSPLHGSAFLQTETVPPLPPPAAATRPLPPPIAPSPPPPTFSHSAGPPPPSRDTPTAGMPPTAATGITIQRASMEFDKCIPPMRAGEKIKSVADKDRARGLIVFLRGTKGGKPQPLVPDRPFVLNNIALYPQASPSDSSSSPTAAQQSNFPMVVTVGWKITLRPAGVALSDDEGSSYMDVDSTAASPTASAAGATAAAAQDSTATGGQQLEISTASSELDGIVGAMQMSEGGLRFYCIREIRFLLNVHRVADGKMRDGLFDMELTISNLQGNRVEVAGGALTFFLPFFACDCRLKK